MKTSIVLGGLGIGALLLIVLLKSNSSGSAIVRSPANTTATASGLSSALALAGSSSALGSIDGVLGFDSSSDSTDDYDLSSSGSDDSFDL